MKNWEIKKLLQAFEDKKLDRFHIIYNRNGTIVFEQKDNSTYLIKLSNVPLKTSMLQKDLLQNIESDAFELATIFHTQSFICDHEHKTLEIVKKVHGESIKDLNEEQIKILILATKAFSRELNKNKEEYINIFPSLDLLFAQISQAIDDEELKKICNHLMNDASFKTIATPKQKYLIYGDMVYENILLDKNNVGFIDIDPIILGHKNLQIAILLTSNVLLQENQFQNLSLELITKYYKLWGINQVTRTDLINLCVFPLLILAMKRVHLKNLHEDKSSMYYKLKEILIFLIDILKKDLTF